MRQWELGRAMEADEGQMREQRWEPGDVVMAHLGLIGGRPDVCHFFRLTLYFLRLARIH